MAAVWSYCKTKMMCEADVVKEEGENQKVEEPKKGHGGCVHPQLLIRKEGLKLFVQCKQSKDEDDVGAPASSSFAMLTSLSGHEVSAARQRFFSASEVYTPFKKVSDSDLHLLGLSDEYARPEWMILTVLPRPCAPASSSTVAPCAARTT